MRKKLLRLFAADSTRYPYSSRFALLRILSIAVVFVNHGNARTAAVERFAGVDCLVPAWGCHPVRAVRDRRSSRTAEAGRNRRA